MRAYEPTYKIVRHFFSGAMETIKEGLTLDEAQEHCRDPETSSRTASSGDNGWGPWFDAYDEE